MVSADKGYDSNKNHTYVIHELNAKSCIKVKKYFGQSGKGLIRKKAFKTFDEKAYHQRSKVETIFSVIKRKYGSVIKSKTYATQKNELLYRILAYNIDRLVKLTLKFMKGFYRAGCYFS